VGPARAVRDVLALRPWRRRPTRYSEAALFPGDRLEVEDDVARRERRQPRRGRGPPPPPPRAARGSAAVPSPPRRAEAPPARAGARRCAPRGRGTWGSRVSASADSVSMPAAAETPDLELVEKATGRRRRAPRASASAASCQRRCSAEGSGAGGASALPVLHGGEEGPPQAAVEGEEVVDADPRAAPAAELDLRPRPRACPEAPEACRRRRRAGARGSASRGARAFASHTS